VRQREKSPEEWKKADKEETRSEKASGPGRNSACTGHGCVGPRGGTKVWVAAWPVRHVT